MLEKEEIDLGKVTIASYLAGEFGDRACVTLTVPGAATLNLTATSALHLAARLVRAAANAENALECEATPEPTDAFWLRSIVALGDEALNQAAVAVVRASSEPDATGPEGT